MTTRRGLLGCPRRGDTQRSKAERQLLDDIAESHKTITAPAAIEWDTRAARVGEQWTTTLYITEYPDYPNDGYLSDLFEMTDIQFDLTAHLTPKNQGGRGTNCRTSLTTFRWMLTSNRAFGVPICKSAPTRAAATYKAVENGARVFDQGLYVTVRADEKDDLRDAVQTVTSALRDDPANLTPKTAICRQDLALQSAAPIGENVFGRTSIALGGAVGAMLSSPHNATILEEGGVEFGIQKIPRVRSSSIRSPGRTAMRCSPSGTPAPGSRSARSKTSSAPSSRARTVSESSSNR